MTSHHGGPAFPQHRNGVGGQTLVSHPGMTLRDYFAAHAPGAPHWFTRQNEYEFTEDWEMDREVQWRWSYAKAMLKARGSDSD